MLPSLWPGDLLTIQSAACDELVPEDIVLVLRDNRFFVHRLVERRQSQDCPSWITRGDAIRHNDAPVAASDLLGRVARIRRANRSFVPSRRLSLLHSALAGMLFRWDGFRNLALRIHGALLRVGSTFAGQLFSGRLRCTPPDSQYFSNPYFSSMTTTLATTSQETYPSRSAGCR